jgi:hypothetical protein
MRKILDILERIIAGIVFLLMGLAFAIAALFSSEDDNGENHEHPH